MPDYETMLYDGILSDNAIVLNNPLEHEKDASNSKTKHNEPTCKYHFFPQAFKY